MFIHERPVSLIEVFRLAERKKGFREMNFSQIPELIRETNKASKLDTRGLFKLIKII